ncbi:30S ribosome-binding factor RbfA [Synoicihabitans lomoniglobus]|uniref:Ribosome-binding factor A n=1 Tax=Synoicihabitans lomoniglobus TaxID=2909285 RepID=A0AAF0CRF9_9BACT|nr:30S ribosome-binding factor RbfA [Opitutaceae bacterium LMO-M01]WED66713.1 30S ribosome-binding factor RbfA [Opitutaceae bacterium LMO-M01]
MSNRTIRIAELVQRELGTYLHTKYKQEAVAITVAGVEVAPDLKTGKVFFSIFGDDETVAERFRWLLRKRGELRRELAKHIKIKHSPDWVFQMDEAINRGNRVLDLLDDIDRADRDREKETNE